MWLRELWIRNLATIEEATLVFHEGFNVLTGETGAGKSIIVDALSLIAGSRSRREFIRSGAKTLALVACFEDLTENIQAFLKRKGLPEDEQLIIQREISHPGANRAYINHQPVTLSCLKELGEHLLAIHGQRNQNTLRNPEAHREVLDRFIQVEKSLKALKTVTDAIQVLEEECQKLQEREKQWQEEKERLSQHLAFIKKVNPQEGEDEHLLQLRERLRRSEFILSQLEELHLLLEEEFSQKFPRLQTAVENLLPYFDTLAPFMKELESARATLNDLAFTLEEIAQSLDKEPLTLEEVEARMDQLEELKRRFGPTLKEVLDYKKNLEVHLQKEATSGETLEALKNELQKKTQAYHTLAESLHKERQKGAPLLAKKISKVIHSLGMESCRVRILVHKDPRHISPYGYDQVRVLVETNPGEGFHPLDEIASGGELSRLQLALLHVLHAKTDRVLIFDEIDQGVGGEAARKVGELLQQLGEKNQVLAVTHFPQVAAWGHQHYRIWKETQENRTFTQVEPLDQDNRVEELARMLGGGKRASTARSHAQKLLQDCQKEKSPTKS